MFNYLYKTKKKKKKPFSVDTFLYFIREVRHNYENTCIK